jgi:tripartite-type tricarboxylate transporter receptor subunit TctC
MAAGAAFAQDYPSKPITVTVPFPPGGGVDRMARLVGDKLRDKLGQPVVVENRPGAAANIGAAYVAKSAPDGYTLLFTSPGPLVVNKALFKSLAYDPDQFVPVTVLMSGPNMLTVHPKLGVDTVQQLIALARSRPGQLNYATQGSGSTAHLATVLFESMAGVKLTHVPYKGTAPVVTDFLGGQVEVFFLELANAHLGYHMPHLFYRRYRTAAACGGDPRVFLGDVEIVGVRVREARLVARLAS